MAERLDLDRRRDRRIGDHQIEVVRRQLRKQPIRRTIATYDLDLFRQPHCRLEQPIGDDLGDFVGDADLKPHRPPRRPISQGVHQLAPEAEDVVGVAIDDAAHVGEYEVAAGALKQFLAELLLEHANLSANGRLREAQLFAGARDGALSRNGPKGTAGGGS